MEVDAEGVRKCAEFQDHGKDGELSGSVLRKCKSKREMKDAKAVTMKNGKPATQGTCPTCNTKMFKIGKA